VRFVRCRRLLAQLLGAEASAREALTLWGRSRFTRKILIDLTISQRTPLTLQMIIGGYVRRERRTDGTVLRCYRSR
jgi:hypothetical protein